MSKRRSSGPSDFSQRLLALAGIVAIVGVVIGIMFATGLLGSQGGGTTDTGVAIQAVTVLDPLRLAGQQNLDVGPEVGKLAPDFELSDFDGTRHKLSGFRGKPVYINFWATWCGPCLQELPDMQVLLDRHPEDLVVITINRRERLDSAIKFFHERPRNDGGTGISFTVNGMDPNDTLYDEYRALSMPVSFFIDAKGVITGLFNGQISLDVMEQELAKARASTESGG